MTPQQTSVDPRNRDYGLISLVLGPPFEESSPFTADDWAALRQLAAIASSFDALPLWRAPLSKVKTLQPIPWGLNSIALFVSRPPLERVRVALIDERHLTNRKWIGLLDNARMPYIAWRGPAHLQTTLLELERWLRVEDAPPINAGLNPFESVALSIVGDWLAQPDLSLGELIPPDGRRESLVMLESVVTDADGPKADLPLVVCAEMGLCVVTRKTQSTHFEWNDEQVGKHIDKTIRFWEQASLDIVVFQGGLDTPPLFAVEVDGPSHKNPRRRKNDELKDAICRDSGIPLVRILIEELPDPRGTLDDQLATRRTWEVKNLWHRAIQLLARNCRAEAAEFKPEKLRIQAAERAIVSKILAERDVTLANVRRKADDFLDARTIASEKLSEAWYELEHRRQSSGCFFPRAPTREEWEATVKQKRVDSVSWEPLRQLGFDPPQTLPGDLNVEPSLIHSYVLDAIARGIEAHGFTLRGPELFRNDRGTGASVELTETSSGRCLRWSTATIRLSGESAHVDLRAIESEVAAWAALQWATAVAFARA